ncbi:MAG TPA: pre-16S rRNA-processing nuclease YqgF [bacterium]|nr:pre-16S rRNA-processing nuclease YqgF [bacterium]
MGDAVLAVDPGREKCGLAVVDGAAVLARAVVTRDHLSARLRSWKQRFAITEVVVGNRTGAEEVAAVIRLELPGVTLTLGDEAGTTLEARRLYFADHPRRGWRRLVPVGLQVPPEPYDDYAAVVVARRRLAGRLPANFDRASRKEEESP